MVTIPPKNDPIPQPGGAANPGPARGTGPLLQTPLDPQAEPKREPKTAPQAAAYADPKDASDVRKHARLDFNDCVQFRPPTPKPAPTAPVYTEAQKKPPNGKTLPTDVRGVNEKNLLAETGGQGALYAVGDWKPGARPLVLVHGIGSDFADLQPIIDKFKNDPTRQVMVYAYSDMGDFTEDSGTQLAYQLNNLRRDYPWAESLDVVAHSMGGIVSRRAMNELAEGQIGGIEQFKDITLTAVDTPWHGFPGPGVRLNVAQGGMDMQAQSELFQGSDEMPDNASKKGLTGVQLPGQVKVNLLFADNEAAGLKRDGIKDYTDFLDKLTADELKAFTKAVVRGNREDLRRALPIQAFNLFTALQADKNWPVVRQKLEDMLDTELLDGKRMNNLLQRYLPRFAGEHSGVLANPQLLDAVAGRLGKSQ